MASNAVISTETAIFTGDVHEIEMAMSKTNDPLAEYGVTGST